MRRAVAGILTASALLLTAGASPATAAPNERACANGHGTQQAHATVPHDNHQAHSSIPHYCDEY